MYYFGIDVHSTYHKVMLLTPEGELKEFDFENDAAGRTALKNLVEVTQPAVVAMEACTGSYELFDLLKPVAHSALLFHPAKFRQRFPAGGRKNDRIDAKSLCEAARYGMTGIWVPDEKVRQARAISRARKSLTERQTQSKNSIRSTFREYHVPVPKNPWSQPGLERLADRAQQLPPSIAVCVKLELQQIESTTAAIEELDQLMAEEAAKNEEIQLLMSVAGIGYHGAYVLMAEIGDWRRFATAKQLASYAGMCPKFNQTGRSFAKLGSISKKGRSLLRWMAVECGQSAARYNPKFRRLYYRVKKRSGITGKAKVAVGRKLLTICYHILKSGTLFSEVDEAKYQAKLRQLKNKTRKRKSA